MGPLGVFEWLRFRLGVKGGMVEGFFPLLFTCNFCMTVWTSIIGYAIWQVEPIVIVIGAAMSVALLANNYIKGE